MHEPDLNRAVWRKSGRSGGNGNCVEVAKLSDAVAIRDSKNPTGPALIVTPAEWAAFIAGAKHGQFDVR
jgi:hypothetical protein